MFCCFLLFCYIHGIEETELLENFQNSLAIFCFIFISKIFYVKSYFRIVEMLNTFHDEETVGTEQKKITNWFMLLLKRFLMMKVVFLYVAVFEYQLIYYSRLKNPQKWIFAVVPDGCYCIAILRPIQVIHQ